MTMMTMTSNPRAWQRALPVAFGLALFASGAAAQPAPAPLQKLALKGKLTTSSFGAVRIHTYLAPADGLLVASEIVETPTALVIFDGQLSQVYGAEVATVAGALGKPVDRIVLSHGHPDHWAGIDPLRARFPDAKLWALPATTEFIRARGDVMLGNVRRAFTDKVAAAPVVPTETIVPGKQTIAGVVFDFQQIADAEADDQLIARLPAQRVLMAFDVVFAPTTHVFTLTTHFDHWIGLLKELQGRKDFDVLLIGHGLPTDRSGLAATIGYLEKAKSLWATANDAKAYSDGLKAAFPARQQAVWIEYSGSVIYKLFRKP
jgi:glyoxylase-like metal-dependent hydrolase (beta-lactamase superfamily II)